MQTVKVGAFEIIRSSGPWGMKAVKFFDLLAGSLIARLLRKKKETPLPPVNTVNKILVIRPGGIGDAVFLLPLLRALSGRFPELEVDILCEKRNAQVFLSQKGICCRVYCYDQFASLFSVLRNSYDVVIDGEQWHYLSAIVAYFLGKKGNIGFATRRLREKLFNRRVAYDLDGYELDNFSRLFEALTKEDWQIVDINSCFLVSDEDMAWVARKIPDKSVSVFLGASIPEKRLSAEQSLNIVRLILERGFCAVLLGGRDALKTAQALEKKVSDKRLLNFTGQASLEQSAAFIKQSKCFIGTDSGLMHLACAVGTPVVAVFGPSNPKKWGPKGERHTVVCANVPCAPCAVFGYTIPMCKRRYACMGEIDMHKLLNGILLNV